MGSLSRRHFILAATGAAIAPTFFPEDAVASTAASRFETILAPLVNAEKARTLNMSGDLASTASCSISTLSPQSAPLVGGESESRVLYFDRPMVEQFATVAPRQEPMPEREIRDKIYPAAAAVVFLDRPGQPERYFGDPNRAYIPASLTKMVTLAVAYDQLKAGRISLNETLPVFTRGERGQLRSTHRNFPNTCSLHDGLLATGITSNNATAASIARRIMGTRANPGTERAFTNRMNIKALGEMGMTRSSFYCASGYNDRSETTLSDQLALLKYFNNDPERCAFFRMCFGGQGVTVAGKFYSSTATVLATRSQNIGLKTGSTTRAGRNISLITEENGERIGITILRASHGGLRNQQVLDMLKDIGYGDPEPAQEQEIAGPIPYTSLVPSA